MVVKFSSGELRNGEETVKFHEEFEATTAAQVVAKLDWNWKRVRDSWRRSRNSPDTVVILNFPGGYGRH